VGRGLSPENADILTGLWKSFMINKIKEELEVLKRISTHPRLPRRCKILAAFLIIYALSPIDLIPDFIPVLGQLDDLIVLPIGLWILYKMVPADIKEEARRASHLDRGINNSVKS
jgi:uncharacterized membrane protein YkvA (DUF1232 family)